jgi:hypothetical protein
LAAWLTPRGLVFNEDKTRIVHLDDGVDFLGFNVRRYRGKLVIKPSKAVKRIRARLTAEMRALRGHNAQMVPIRLNPIIRGWSAYYRHAVSARVFNETSDTTGWIRLWLGGVRQTFLNGADTYFVRTQVPGTTSVYYKEGYYREAMAPTGVVFTTGFRCATDEEAL